MATAGETAATAGAPQSPGPSRPRPDNQRDCQGRSRGRGNSANSQAPREGEARGGGARRGRGGSRGANASQGRTRTINMSASDLFERFAQPPISNGMLQEAPQAGKETQCSDSAPAEEAVEAEVCFICASPVVHNSVAPCNHRTCHICALRMRALYESKDCPHCRVSLP